MTATTSVTTSVTTRPPMSLAQRVAGFVRRGIAIWIVVAVLVIALSAARGESLWSQGNIAALLTSAVVLGIVALGQFLVVVSGGIDLSVGAVVSLVTLLTAMLIDGYPIRTVPVIIGAILLGGLLGGINGGIVTAFRMPPFIVTLATMYIFGGVALWISSVPAGQVTSAMSAFANGRLGPIPLMFLVLAALIVVVWFLTSRMTWGRHLFAAGGDLEAARLAGIRTNRTILWAYIIAGLLAGVAGVLLAARSTIGSPTAGNGLELSAITVVVLGGTSLLGGKGTILGTMGGVALLALITNSITLLQFPSTITDLIRGVVIIAAAAIFVTKRRR
jgi:ribose transport system permease protein